MIRAIASGFVDHSTRAAILLALCLGLAIACVPEAAFAQRAGARPNPAPHAGPARVFAPPILRPRPIHPVRPIFLIFPPIGFRFIGEPIFGFGLGFGYTPLWWENCGPYWGWVWGSSCYLYEPPVYFLEGEGRELPQLYLKDGTVYNVTDYWMVDNQLHFTTLDESGTKWVEHTIDFDELDLQKTVDVARQRGFNFVLRNEPLREYLRDHPGNSTPATTPQSPIDSEPKQK